MSPCQKPFHDFRIFDKKAAVFRLLSKNKGRPCYHEPVVRKPSISPREAEGSDDSENNLVRKGENHHGKQNINSVTQCITRLRFKLKDESKANTHILNQTDGVIKGIQANGQ